MLAAITNDGNLREISTMPRSHRPTWRIWRERLPVEDHATIQSALHEVIDEALKEAEPVTTSWIPGSDWRGTPYQPLYEKVCPGDPEAAAKFFGSSLLQMGDDAASGSFLRA